MGAPIDIGLVVEDDLAEAVARKLLRLFGDKFNIAAVYAMHGSGKIKMKLSGFSSAAKVMPYFVLVDSDGRCPRSMVGHWLPSRVHPNLLFRIAVREVEAWVLADRSGVASYLGVPRRLIPQDADQIADPKRHLVGMAKRSRRRLLREAIAPAQGSTARVGPDYNGQLSCFVEDRWDIDEAVQGSASLQRCVTALDRFRPT